MLMHAMHSEERTVARAVRGGEDCSEDDQPRQRECPESEVFPEGAQRALGAGGKNKNHVAADGERGRRQQRQEIDHASTWPSGLWILGSGFYAGLAIREGRHR